MRGDWSFRIQLQPEVNKQVRKQSITFVFPMSDSKVEATQGTSVNLRSIKMTDLKQLREFYLMMFWH